MTPQELWWSTGISKWFKKRRLKVMTDIMGDLDSRKLKILDVGCATGKDFIKHFADHDNLSFTGVDLDDYKIEQANCTVLKEDAADLPFEDKSFDYVVSMGLLEHIVPIEKLAQAVREIDRVGKNYCIVVPCINTIIEPHLKTYRWQLRSPNLKSKYMHGAVNYMSDDAWLSFEGFADAKVKRYWYIPGLICNLIIYSDR